MLPSERLKALHELAQAERRRDRERAELVLADLRQADPLLTELLVRSYLRDLRDWAMTDDELEESRRLELDDERDRTDDGWTR